MNGAMKEAIADFDRTIKLRPRSAPYNWQRGLALYYADQFQLGRKQFESHQTVNGGDVENAVWHFLCVARKDGVEKARELMYPFRGDTRVPMKQIHEMFSGDGTVDEVLRAAESGSKSEQPDQRYYAQLYIGLYWEVFDEPEKSRKAMEAAQRISPFKPDVLMGRVAHVHLQLRKIGDPTEKKKLQSGGEGRRDKAFN